MIIELTEKRRIENARTPIRMRMKKERTFPKAFLKVVPLEVSDASIDDQNQLRPFQRGRETQRRLRSEEGFCGL